MQAPKELTREDARQIINIVRMGTPPEFGFHYFTAGAIQRYLEVIEREYLADFIKNGGAAFKMVVGIYGEGKTHFLYHLRDIAWKHNFLMSYIQLSDTECPFDKLELVYQAIVKEVTRPLTAEELRSGYEKGIEALIRSWHAQMRDRFEEQGLSGSNLAQALREYAEDTVRGFENVNFTRAVRSAFMVVEEGRYLDFETLMQWLKAEGRYDRRQLAPFGINQRIDRSSAFSVLRSLIQWSRAIGYSGLVVLMDEAETRPSMRGHRKNILLSNLRELIDQCGQGRLRGSFIVYAVPDESFLEGRSQVYEALRQRLRGVFDHEVNPTGVKIYLDPEHLKEDTFQVLAEIGRKLWPIYERAFEVSLDPEHTQNAIEDIARDEAEGRFGETGVKRRYVQRIIQAFERLHREGKPITAEDVVLQ